MPANELAAVCEEAVSLPQLGLTKLDTQWLQVLSEGWASPLTGFMRERELLQCLHFATLLDDGVASQSVPIVLPTTTQDKLRLEGENSIALTYQGKLVTSGLYPVLCVSAIFYQLASSHVFQPLPSFMQCWRVRNGLVLGNTHRWSLH